MSRILLGLSGLNTLVLLGTFTVGFLCEGRAHVRPDTTLTEAQRMFTLHLFGGLGAALITLLLHSLVLTYFIGTGRWMQEVLKAYSLPATPWERSRGLKIQALPYILGGIVSVILAATLGAAADVGRIDRNVHLVIATVAVAFNLWSYVREYRVVVENGNLISGIMDDVKRMRAERGLD